MSQKMPVVSQVHRPALIPQFCAIAVITFLGWVAFRNAPLPLIVIGSAIVFSIFNRTMRFFFARQHKLGIRAYRAQQFEKAIEHYELSYIGFCRHPLIDRYRSILLGSASGLTYRVIALCNIGFCYAQLADGKNAVTYYEKALAEDPECTLAQVSLRMLQSMKGNEKIV